MNSPNQIFTAQGRIKHVLEILTNLKFIASLEPGDKFYTSDRSICKPTFYDRFIRSFSGENKELIYAYLDKHISTAVAFVDTADKEDVIQDYVSDIINALRETLKGIDALKQTYEGNRIFVIRLSTLEDIITKALTRYEKDKTN